MDIDKLQAQWALGLLRPQQLPGVATQAMGLGYRGRCLENLAVMDPRRDMPEELVDGALREMGRDPITPLEAVQRLARMVSEKILRKQLPPLEGAEEISTLLRRFDWEDVPRELRLFRWSPEATERWTRRTLTDEQRIVELAWALLEEGADPTSEADP